MDDGVKVAALIFRIGLAAKEMMLKIAIEGLKAIIRHMEWLKQHNIKPSWKARIDRTQIKFVQVTTSLVEKQLKNYKDKVVNKERELDKFKLDKQYELEKYKTEVHKAQKDFELALNSKDTVEIAKKQQLLNQALENKKNFEYKINQEIMAKAHELDNYKTELNQCEYDLKVCQAKLNALYSYQNVETGRVKTEYNDIKEKYTSNEVELEQENEVVFDVSSLDEVANNFKEKQHNQEKESQSQDIENVEEAVEVDVVAKMFDKDPEGLKAYKELFGTNKDVPEVLEKPVNKEVKEDIKEDIKEVDVVVEMFKKDPKALKAYEDMKSKGEFNINVATLSKNKSVDI